jgi:hypothetical protein
MIRTILAISAASFGIASAQADEIQSGVPNPGSFGPVIQTETVPQVPRGTDWLLSGVQNPVRSGS